MSRSPEYATLQHDEIGVAVTLFSDLDLAHWTISGNTKFTQKRVGAQITAGQGDYAFID